MADWKKVSKIDAHIHILPDDVIAANAGVEDSFVLAGGVEKYVRLMDENNIAKAIIMPLNDPFLMSMTFTVSDVHRNLMSFQKRYGDRFLLFADVDVRNSVEETLTELKRVMPSGAFAGIKIHPSNTGMEVDCAYFDTVFSYAEENGIPVEIHSYPTEKDNTDVCAPKRIVNVLRKHPTLRVSVAHLGGLQYADLIGKNVWVNISAVLPDLVDKLGMKEVNRILRKFGIDKLIFATDYPDSRSLGYSDIYPKYFEILNQMDFSDAEIEAVCRENILAFLNK